MPDTDVGPPNADFADFGSKARQILQDFAAEVERRPVPPLIFHYTNYAGLLGILDSGHIWMSDAFKMNDPSEVKYGLSKFAELMRQLLNPDLHSLSGALIKSIEQFYTTDRIHYHNDIFIGSFSANQDELGQWRAYGDNGAGYALGFDTASIEKPFCDSPKPHQYKMSFEVVYSTDRLERLFTEIITEAKTILDAPKPTSNIEEWKKSMAQFYSDILFYITTGSFLFKHPAYSNEQEYRFLHGIPSAFAVTPHKYRLRPHSLISYKELDWKPNGASALRRIVVGPAGDQAKAERFAKDCLRRTGLNEIEIVHSEIPYRLT